MSKINVIKIEHFKAIDKLEADFKGCTAIITGGNNKGKTSFLRGMVDRIRFIRPNVMVKEGEEIGKGELTLDTGERFVWDFDVNGKDKLFYYDKKGIKQNVTKEISAQFFPKGFDVDKFMASPPKDQSAQLQKIVGLDFTDIDKHYALAYADRTSKNQMAELYHAKLSKWEIPAKVDFVDLEQMQEQKQGIRHKLNTTYNSNKAHNDSLRNAYDIKCQELRYEVAAHNKKQEELEAKYAAGCNANGTLMNMGYNGHDAAKFLHSFKEKIEPLKEYVAPEVPEYIKELPDDTELKEIDAKILEASKINVEAQKYKEFIDYKEQVKNSRADADKANELVLSIEEERNALIAKAKFPKGVSIGFNGITLDGLPFERDQISTSALYTTALRIGAMNLGEVKTLYFDASFLDRHSLAEIEKWAQTNDLQLLIERPDFDGGEIKYELIETI